VARPHPRVVSLRHSFTCYELVCVQRLPDVCPLSLTPLRRIYISMITLLYGISYKHIHPLYTSVVCYLSDRVKIAGNHVISGSHETASTTLYISAAAMATTALCQLDRLG